MITRKRVAGLPKGAGLTPRELEVCQLLAQAKCDKEISVALGISKSTTRFHVSNILRKLRVTSRAEVIVAVLEAAR